MDTTAHTDTAIAAHPVVSGAAGQHEAHDAPDGCGLRERKKLATWHAIHEAANHLVDERGLAGTTVEAICGEAEVSMRTFFNYFPSKSAAALGLPAPSVDPEARERFLAGEGELIGEVCDLVAAVVKHDGDRIRLKELVKQRPELGPAFAQWVAELRDQLIGLVAQRVDPDKARLAVGVGMIALTEAAQRGGSDDDLAVRLREVVRDMTELAATKG